MDAWPSTFCVQLSLAWGVRDAGCLDTVNSQPGLVWQVLVVIDRSIFFCLINLPCFPSTWENCGYRTLNKRLPYGFSLLFICFTFIFSRYTCAYRYHLESANCLCCSFHLKITSFALYHCLRSLSIKCVELLLRCIMLSILNRLINCVLTDNNSSWMKNLHRLHNLIFKFKTRSKRFRLSSHSNWTTALRHSLLALPK